MNKKQEMTSEEELRIGVFICHCGLNIAGTIDIKELVEYSKTIPDVVFVKENRYTCADPGQEEIRKGIKDYQLNRVVVAACSPRMHEPTFRRTVSEAGLNPFLYEMANIREFASWCHPNNPKEAMINPPFHVPELSSKPPPNAENREMTHATISP